MSKEIVQGHVRVETHQGITTIEFFHPQSNSLPSDLLQELAKTFRRLGDDVATKIIILRSAGSGVFVPAPHSMSLLLSKRSRKVYIFSAALPM